MRAPLPSSDLTTLAARIRDTIGQLIYFDIGARDGLSPAWSALAAARLIGAYGFDPAADHLADLMQRNDGVTYLPIALGDYDGRRRLIHTYMPGCSSFLQPNVDLLKAFPSSRIFEVIGSSEVETRTLDSLVRTNAVPSPHVLKLDTQGFELPILKAGVEVLERVICIEMEVQFKPLYIGQALFPEIKAFLDEHGFILRQLEVNGPYEGEYLEANAFFSRRPALDENLDVIRLWQTACQITSPQFLSQMDDWQLDWKAYLTEDQMELRRRLFGRLE